MSNFSRLPEFEKEFRRLAKRYRSLEGDLDTFEQVITSLPTGQGKNFTILHSSEAVTIVKARLACRTLRERSLRIIYSYREGVVEFVYIELYFKGDKENEDRKRIENYLDSVNSLHKKI